MNFLTNPLDMNNVSEKPETEGNMIGARASEDNGLPGFRHVVRHSACGSTSMRLSRGQV